MIDLSTLQVGQIIECQLNFRDVYAYCVKYGSQNGTQYNLSDTKNAQNEPVTVIERIK